MRHPTSEPSGRNSPRDPHRGLRPFAILASAFVILLTAATFLAWAIGQGTLPVITPGLPVMVPLMAVGLGLSGIAFALVAFVPQITWARRLGQALGLAVATLGAAVLIAKTLEIDLGLERLLFPATIHRIGAGILGVPSALGAVNLLLTGSSIAYLGRRTVSSWKVAQACALPVGFLSLAGIVAYLYGAEGFFGLPGELP